MKKELTTMPQDTIDILKDGLRTGKILSRKEVHQKGVLHRAVHLYLFDSSGNILLQRRSEQVDHYPGMWSISLTGHVDAGEGSSVALRRELREELNLKPEDVTFEHVFSYRRSAVLGDYKDDQINEVFIGFLRNKREVFPFDLREVSEIKFVSFEKFLQMVQSPTSGLAPVYKEACTDLVYYLGSRLKSEKCS